MKYRKKPVVIDAIQWDGENYPATTWLPNLTEFPDYHWTEGAKRAALSPEEITRHLDFLHIGTLEGVMACAPGDWIIRGVKGEIYPCKPDIFAATYEPVEL